MYCRTKKVQTCIKIEHLIKKSETLWLLVSCCQWTNLQYVKCHTFIITHVRVQHLHAHPSTHPQPPTHFHSDLAAENFLWLTQSILKLNITFKRCALLLGTLTSAKSVPRERLPVVLKHQPVKPTNDSAILTVRRSKWKLFRGRVLWG